MWKSPVVEEVAMSTASLSADAVHLCPKFEIRRDFSAVGDFFKQNFSASCLWL